MSLFTQLSIEDDAGTGAAGVVAVFHEATGITAAPEEMLAHRWRYALSKGLNAGCLWDARHRIGACGDWCADGRTEGAYLSGIQLATTLRGVL